MYTEDISRSDIMNSDGRILIYAGGVTAILLTNVMFPERVEKLKASWNNRSANERKVLYAAGLILIGVGAGKVGLWG